MLISGNLEQMSMETDLTSKIFHTIFYEKCAGGFRREIQNFLEKQIHLPVSRKNTFLGQHATTVILRVLTTKVYEISNIHPK